MTENTRNKFKNGIIKNCSKSEKQEMLSYFHKERAEFEIKEILMHNLLHDETISNDVPDIKVMFSKLWSRIEKSQKHKSNKTISLYRWSRIAAAILIGLITGIYLASLKQTSKETIYFAAHSPKGSVSELVLPDSTIVFLNADSRIQYRLDNQEKKREVFLKGEAWFDVKRNKEKPFYVRTPVYDIKVTGTQFNVKAYESDNEIVTTLEEGQIIIQSTDLYKLPNDITINPGEQVVLNKTSRNLLVKNVNTKWYTSWKENKLIFVNMNLKDLVVLLERKFGVDIEVKNKELLSLHFDGTIKNESIVEFLEIIKTTLPIDYKIVGQRIVITNIKN